MKFIHTADIHLDSGIKNIPSEKSKILKEEVICAFENLCVYAKNNDIKAVILAGDTFDTLKISLKIRNRFFRAISDAKDTDFLYLSGNHDENELIKEAENIPSNFKTFSDSWTYFEYGDVVICGIKLTSANSNFIYDTLKLEQNKKNIVVLHGQIAGYKSNGVASEIISIPRLKEKNIDYLALGHIHSYSRGEIDNRGIYAYSGCLNGRGFDETGEKGFVEIDYDKEKLVDKFIKFSSREFYEYAFDVSSYSSFLEARDSLIADICSKYPASSLIKVVLTGERNTDIDFDTESLTQKLNDLFFFVKIYDKTNIKISLCDFEADKSIKGEFVRTVMNSDLPQDKKNAVIECGLKLLREGGKM